MSTHLLKRQSRMARNRRSSLMAPILEDLEPGLESATKSTQSSIKAKRRQGVSNLRLPPLDVFTVDEASGWRLTLAWNEDDDDVVEIFDFPQPPSSVSLRKSHDRESGDDSSSSDSHSDRSTPATTPGPSPTGPSPTAESYVAPKQASIVRCKTIKPLTITKRSASPAPPAGLSTAAASTVTSRAPAASTAPASHVDETDDDEDFYATYARNFIALTPLLPPSFPSPSTGSCSSPLTTQRAHRESVVILAPSPACSFPPPPAVDSHSRSSSSSSTSTLSPQKVEVPNFSRPISIRRPPPRTPVPADVHESVWSGDFASYYGYYAPLISSAPSSSLLSEPALPAVHSSSAPTSSPSITPFTPSRSSPLPSTPSSSASPCISVTATRRIAEVPSDIDADEWEWDDHTDASLSPIVAPNPDLDDLTTFEDDRVDATVDEKHPPLPSPLQLYTGWHPRPRESQLRRGLEGLLPREVQQHTKQPRKDKDNAPPTPTPVLRSRWSSSSLSSVRSSHAHNRGAVRPPGPTSPKTFSFARRYFPRPKASVPSSVTKPARAHPKPMGSVTILHVPKRARKAKRLTVDDVVVVHPPSASGSPDALGASAPASATGHSRQSSEFGHSACSGAGEGSGTVMRRMFLR
ncbi:hypothetical protein GGX14DRAFT_402598 [Mycena pura]|uniref:Uncharacterized protein n=1 Tax=Mycena pura TaxID=153505 RepID=A0AAD6Y227_9AGAR|nr:hypothetical protein GGX14DRAFT_402598 [Mycena pura]